MIENLAMQYLTGQLVISYRTINRFRVAEGMEELIRNLFMDLNLRLKMEELVTLDCLFIDGTKIEANANKYSFVWKNPTDTKTLLPLLETYPHDIKTVVADAGYGSEASD